MAGMDTYLGRVTVSWWRMSNSERTISTRRRIGHAVSLCVETLHRELGMTFYCDGVTLTGTLRVALHMVM